MPTYVYRREDGSTFEIEQRITEAPLEACPETGQKVRRVISGSAGLIFKGSGFYLTDYARKNGSSASGTKNGAAKNETSDAKASDSGGSTPSDSASAGTGKAAE